MPAIQISGLRAKYSSSWRILFSDELHDTPIRRIFRVCEFRRGLSTRDAGRAVYTLRQFADGLNEEEKDRDSPEIKGGN